MANAKYTITILDLPEIMDILREALDAVPDWERTALYERFEQIIQRARQQRWRQGGT